MFWIKSCPRCNGDLYENTDQYGRFIACMQCSHYLNEDDETAIRHSTSLGLSSWTQGADLAVRPLVGREPVASAA